MDMRSGIIDVHVHLRGDGLPNKFWRAADRYGVEKVMVSSLGRVWRYVPNIDEFREANADVARLIKERAERVIGYVYVNPCYEEEALDEVKKGFQVYGCKGLKLWVSCICTDPRVEPLVEWVTENNGFILLHSWQKATGNLPGESTPADVATLAKRYPDTVFIMAHIGGDWERGIKAVRNCPNVLIDTCGSITSSGAIERAVKYLGARRVVYGSDACGNDFGPNIGKIYSACLPEEDERKIFKENIEEVLTGRWLK